MFFAMFGGRERTCYLIFHMKEGSVKTERDRASSSGVELSRVEEAEHHGTTENNADLKVN